jgi:enoyl-[acyl-carrier-protein] reductase (NADH)
MISITEKPFVLITGAAVRIGRVMVLDFINKRYMVGRTPLQKPVQLEDLIQAVYFCVNKRSLTGEIITVDSGYQLI